MEIVDDFDEQSYNNNGKPWKPSGIFRVKSNFIIFPLFIIVRHFFRCFFIFFIFSFFVVFFIFSLFQFFFFAFFFMFFIFHFLHFFFISLIFFIFSFLSFFHFFHFFIFLHLRSGVVSSCEEPARLCVTRRISFLINSDVVQTLPSIPRKSSRGGQIREGSAVPSFFVWVLFFIVSELFDNALLLLTTCCSFRVQCRNTCFRRRRRNTLQHQ